MKYKIRVDYEITPIRHLVVQCPYCENWFDAHEIIEDSRKYPRWEHQIDKAEYYCPKCNCGFGENYEICEPEEVPIPDEGIHHGVLRKKVVWE